MKIKVVLSLGCSVLFFVWLTFSLNTTAQEENTEDVKLTLEEPAQSGTYTGISNLRGWAVAASGIDRIEAYIDGDYVFDIPMGGLRGDVANAYPDYPNSNLSGFSMAFNYKGLSPGEHEVLVKAISVDGNQAETSAVFTVKKFVNDYIRYPSEFALQSITDAFVSGDSLVIKGATVEGEQWDFSLSFDTASQGLEITDITESTDPVVGHQGLFRPGNSFLYQIDYLQKDSFADNACGGICETSQSWMSVSGAEKWPNGLQPLIVSIETSQGYLDGTFYFNRFGSLMEWERLLSSHYSIRCDEIDCNTTMPFALGERDKPSIGHSQGFWFSLLTEELQALDQGISRRLGKETFYSPNLGGNIETRVTMSERQIENVSDVYVSEIKQRVWWSERLGLYRMEIQQSNRCEPTYCFEDSYWTLQLIDYQEQ